MSDWLRSKEIADRLGLSRRSVQRLAKRGHIPAITLGGSLAVPKSVFESWLKDQETAAFANAASKENGHARETA